MDTQQNVLTRQFFDNPKDILKSMDKKYFWFHSPNYVYRDLHIHNCMNKHLYSYKLV